MITLILTFLLQFVTTQKNPFLPTKAKKFHHNFPDPAKATGTDQEISEQFRQVRQQIKDYCRQFVTDHLH